MSEYQYYDFRAIDRPLTSAQRGELGKISTRAEISSTRFTNFYTFGDFEGTPVALVERYFDVFLYLANWGTRELMFRVPLAQAPAARVLRSYLSSRFQSAAWFRVRGPYVIFGFLSEDEDGDWESDGEGELASIVPIRSDLHTGSLRILYLAWLLRVQAGDVGDGVAEPAVPEDLARLSGGEAALVEFLRIDLDLIAAAAERPAGQAGKARTAGQLLSIAKARREEAEQRAAQKAQREREKREAAAAIIRASHLRQLAAREADAWREVVGLVESRKPAAYDQAVVLLQDLRELCDTTGRSPKFRGFVHDSAAAAPREGLVPAATRSSQGLAAEMRRGKVAVQREHFKFDVAEWKFDYGFHVNAEASAGDFLGPCWEGHHLTISGPLRSKTKRRNCASVKMTFYPAEVVPSKWSTDKKGFGTVEGVRRGVLGGIAFLPSQSFHSFLTALSAGKVRRCYVGLRDVVRGAGTIDSFFTVDPVDDDNDDE